MLLIILTPVLLLTAVTIFITNRGNVFFVQIRPGKGEKLFKLIKFKSMTDKKDKDGVLLPDNMRLTFIGNIFRKTSLDELPQLINVLKGDMSLIGPRPLLVEYLPMYSDFQKRRHNVKPGITGWAQVNGRNSISWEGKFKLDVWYVDNLSFAIDLKILLLTIKKVFERDGISKEGFATTDAFNSKS
jgi:lipopolysaccharide/colanic/teichoic acid biosynthesis glycosyltransferase